MRRFLLSRTAPLGLAVLAVPAIAQTPAQPTQVAAAPPLEEVVVTAGRIPMRVDAATSSVTVLTAEILERRQHIFVLDALAATPGVSIAQNGAFGGQATVRIRGAASEQTLFLVDGVAINDTTSPGGGFNAAFLDTADIERLEVLRGPHSTLWGSDAIGGVVNVVTRAPAPGIGTRAFAEGGSYATRRGGASLAAGLDRVDVRLGVSAIGTDGISKADARDNNPEADPYRAAALDGRAGWNVAEGLRLEAFGRWSDTRTHFDSFGVTTGVRDGNELNTTDETLFGGRVLLDLFDGRLRNELQATQYDIGRRSFTNGSRNFQADGRRRALRWQGTAKIVDGLTLVAGAEREKSSTSSTGASRSTTIDGVFALAEATPMAGLVLNAGVRRDDHSRAGARTTPRLGASYTPIEALTLKASWGKGFKAPSIFQLTSFFPPATAPNPDLQPEAARGWDAGGVVRLWQGRARLEATYFRIDTNNLIQFVAAGNYVNVARARSSGVELAASLDLTDTLSLTANYTRTKAINAATGVRLSRQPGRTAFAELDWRPLPGLGINLTERFTGEATDTLRPANPQGRIGGWTRTDLAVRYDVTGWAQLYARLENLLDKKYQQLFGYGTPGRSIFGGVRVRFE